MHTEADRAAAAKMTEYIANYGKSMPETNIDNAFVRSGQWTAVSVETDSTPAKATYTVNVPSGNRNNPYTKSIHGGAIATFFDNSTSMALFACKRPWDGTGVTRNLNVTYLRPPFEGDRIDIECEVVQLTKRLATIRGVMKRASDGTVLAVCQHDKVRVDPPGPLKSNL